MEDLARMIDESDNGHVLNESFVLLLSQYLELVG
jgi:hypothetical protein